jgi:hypothetical protein
MQLDSSHESAAYDGAAGIRGNGEIPDKREGGEFLAELFVPKSLGCVSSAIPDPGPSRAKLQRRDPFGFSIDIRYRDASVHSAGISRNAVPGLS